MKYFLLMWFSLGFIHLSQAQVVTIYDSENNQPLDMVTLHSSSPNTYAITNSVGQADISNFLNSQEIVIRKIGYKTATLSFEEIRTANFSVFLTQSSISLDQVVVSATRWRQTTSNVASRITTITPQQVTMYNPQTAADLLGMSGEVFIQKSQLGGGSPMIRGFATNRILYAVDGVRMNTAIFRSGNLQNVISLDPFAVSATEVLFGPASVIYGSDALGGVLSFSTLNPELSVTNDLIVSGSADARYSSAGSENTYHFDVRVGSKKWGSVTSFSNFNFGDLQMGSKGPKSYLRRDYVERINGTDMVIRNNYQKIQRPTGYNQANLMQKLRFKPSNSLDITYGLHYSETSDYDRYDSLIEYDGSGLPKSAQWYYGPQIWLMNNLNMSVSNSSLLFDEITIRLAHQYFQESRVDRKFNNNNLRDRVEKVTAYSLNFDVLKNLTDTQQLFYGVEAVYDDVTSGGERTNLATGVVTDVAPRYPESDWSSYAAYLNYINKLGSMFTLQAGVRYNQFLLNARFVDTYYQFPFSKAELNEGALTSSLGLILKPLETMAINAVVSTGFRAPNVDDIGKVFDSEPGSVVVPNPNLKSEYAYNAELGINNIFGDVFKIDITGYYTLLDNALVRRDFTLNGQSHIMYDGQLSQVQAIQNAANATIFGVQLAAELYLPAGFSVTTRYNFQEGEEEMDDGKKSPLRHAPPAFGTTHLMYTSSRATLDFYSVYSNEIRFKDMPLSEIGKTYMYAIDSNGKPYSPGWVTFNLKGNYKATDMFSFSAGVENITDIRYRPYSSGIVSPGRNLIFSIKANF